MLALLTWGQVQAWSATPGGHHDHNNFVRALAIYGVAHEAPHPPGYPLWVGLARLASWAIGQQYAYQLVNLTALLAVAAAVWFIGGRIGRPSLGLAAAILVLSHPLSLYSTATPSSYISDAFVSAGLVAACLFAFPRSVSGGVACAFAVMLVCGLSRAASCLMLLPLAIALAWLLAPRSKAVAALSTLLAVGMAGLTAYGLTIFVNGGLDVYRTHVQRVMAASAQTTSVFFGADWRAHALALARLTIYLVVLAAPAALLALFAFRRLCMSRTRRGDAAVAAPLPPRTAAWLLAAWVVPPLAFYGLVHVTKFEHLHIIMPAASLVAAWALHAVLFASRPRAAWAATALVAGAGLSYFWLAPPQTPWVIAQVTHPYIVRQDRAYAELRGALAALDVRRPGTLVVFHWHPDLVFANLRTMGMPRGYLAHRHGQEGYAWVDEWLRNDPVTDVPPGTERVVLIAATPDGNAIVQELPVGHDRAIQTVLAPAGRLSTESSRRLTVAPLRTIPAH